MCPAHLNTNRIDLKLICSIISQTVSSGCNKPITSAVGHFGSSLLEEEEETETLLGGRRILI